MKDAIYIGASMLDLYENNVIATTIKRLSIGDISKRYISYSNSFTVPRTNNNEVLLGYPSTQESTSSKPYMVQNARYDVDGVTIIPEAILIVDESIGNGIRITIYEKDYTFFKDIEGLTIADVNPIPSTSWQPDNIDVLRLATSGIVSVVLNWGKSGGIYQQNFFLPCFYYHTLIRSIFEFTGLEISGSILSDARFTDLVVPFSGEFRYPDQSVNSLSGKANVASNYSIPDLNTGDGDVKINLGIAEYGGDNFDLVDDIYIFNGFRTASIEAVFDLSSITWGDGTTITVKIKDTSGDLATNTITSPSASGVVIVTYSGNFVDTTEISATISSDAVVATAVTINTGSYLKVTVTNDVSRSDVNWNNLWPNISCKDLVKDFLVRFGVVTKEKDGVIYFKTIEEIINDRANALDWSSKVVGTDSIDFGTTYAQSNKMIYRDSEDVNSHDLGMGEIDVDNNTLPEVKTIYTSIFENTTTEVTSGYNVATIPVYDSTSADIGDIVNPSKLKLLTTRDRVDESAITFYVTPRTDYLLGHFIDQTQTKDTGFQYFIDQFYHSFRESIQRTKTITKYFNLDSLDIHSYDQHVPIWDGQAYYIIESIDKFVSGKLTKVELLKV